jgi:hypothetical protein
MIPNSDNSWESKMMHSLHRNPIQISDLNGFKRKLERDFFADVHLVPFTDQGASLDLSIEMHCNFRLAELLFFFNQQYWQEHLRFGELSDDFSLESSLLQIGAQLEREIDIEELTLFLKDTSITIHRIHKQSISRNLYGIFAALMKHQVFLTQGYSQMPYEIYLPVFEEAKFQNGTEFEPFQNHNSGEDSDYFGYWGLYYEGQDEAMIYDLNHKRIIPGNLFMLNE